MEPTPSFSLRIALDSDMPFLESLRKLTMRSLIEKHYAWNDREQHDRIRSHFECARIITTNRRDIGLFKVVPELSEIHLSQVQLLPEFQGKGIASALIRKLQEETSPSGLPITLHVLRSNRAISLYHHLDFITVRENDHFFFMQWTPIKR